MNHLVVSGRNVEMLQSGSFVLKEALQSQERRSEVSSKSLLGKDTESQESLQANSARAEESNLSTVKEFSTGINPNILVSGLAGTSCGGPPTFSLLP